MNETLFICKECKESTKRVIRGQCEKCYAESKDSKKQLEQITTELLAWAGLHRGKAISEDAMPRFHEIIDRLDAIIK